MQQNVKRDEKRFFPFHNVVTLFYLCSHIQRRNSVTINGLTEQQAAESRRLHGTNVLTPPKRPSAWLLYAEKYKDPMVQILLVAAVVSLALSTVTGQFLETVGIIVAVLLATTVGFLFERDAARKFDVLTRLSDEQPVKVVRDGQTREIARSEVVVGDVVVVETGDEVPADGLLVESVALLIDESSLTGEPQTQKAAASNSGDRVRQTIAGQTPPDGEHSEGTYPADVVLRSTMVLEGNGRFVVTAVGDATEIGQVARQAAELTGVKTPLNIQLDRLAKLISKVGGGLSVACFLVFTIHDMLTNPLWHTGDYLAMSGVVLNYFMMAVTLVVMAVPEGLPMAVTLALALNMRRMLRSGNLVRKLQASETMGAVTVICTDKTGTLTENRMTVRQTFVNPMLEGLMAPAIVGNGTATLNADGHGIGNPTEIALLRTVSPEVREEWKSRAQIISRDPFSTEKKQMTTVLSIDGGSGMTFVKGAPEVVLKWCRWDGVSREYVEQLLADWQRQAMRTLAFTVDGQFQAVVAISDPLRADVPEAVGRCRQAGIAIKVVTGDTAATAVEIARQAGIVDGAVCSVTGPEFESMDDAEALAMVTDLQVMSRARPSDKQRLVRLLQERGEVVAVTGDGTNDAPALNRAHVGLSLGSGTTVAKEASDITLLDDSFASIVNAVMWGRSLYLNIRRFLFFQLVVNVSALLLVLAGAFFGTEMPLTITQILWVNLIMDTFAAMALASLPPSREVLSRPPRRSGEFIISPDMARAIAVVGVLFATVMSAMLWYFEHVAGVDAHELTVFFTIFVMIQWWNLFNARCLGSRHSAFRRLWACRNFIGVLLLIAVGQWLIVTFGGRLFRTEPLSAVEWLLISGSTSLVLWAGELWRLKVRLTSPCRQK